MIAPTNHVPVTTLDAAITIGAGSTLDIEATDATTGIINNGTILVAPGGTLIVDDVDDPHAVADVNKNAEVDSPFNNDLLFGNGGTISVQGAAGHTTRAVIIADTQGPGAVVVAGNGALPGLTSLSVDGYMYDQTITVSDAAVRFNDAQTAIGTPGSAGFDVKVGAFIFADAHGTLILNQAPLTTLVLKNGHASQQPDYRTPFTTPISGFGTGDTIQLVGQYIAGVGLTYATAYNPTTGVLMIESTGSGGHNPAIYAALQLVGTYNAASFVLTGNASTHLLTLTYIGEPGVPAMHALAPQSHAGQPNAPVHSLDWHLDGGFAALLDATGRTAHASLGHGDQRGLGTLPDAAGHGWSTEIWHLAHAR